MLSAYFRDLCKTLLGPNIFYRIKFKVTSFKKALMFAKMFIDMLHNSIDQQLYWNADSKTVILSLSLKTWKCVQFN